MELPILMLRKEYGLLEPKFQEFNNIFRVELFRDSLPMTLENKNIGEASEKHRRSIGETSEKHRRNKRQLILTVRSWKY